MLNTREKIVAALEAGVPAAEIARKEGLDRAYVRKIAMREGLTLVSSKPGPKPLTEREILSPLYAQIGRALYHFRVVQHGSDEREMAMIVGLSIGRLRDAENGFAALDLSELGRIAAALGMTIAELVTERSAVITYVRA